jgi:hypothetical protein
MGYIFDPARLQEICKPALGLEREEMVETVIGELARAYPGHIETRQNWVFNIAGGITGIMNVLHGSMTEYLLFFGTPGGTDGFSGRYLLDIYDVVLSGRMKTYEDDTPLKARTFEPGDLALLRKGRVKGVSFSEDNFMLEYGRGLIASSLPYALISANDPQIILKTVWIYGRLVVKEILSGKL